MTEPNAFPTRPYVMAFLPCNELLWNKDRTSIHGLSGLNTAFWSAVFPVPALFEARFYIALSAVAEIRSVRLRVTATAPDGALAGAREIDAKAFDTTPSGSALDVPFAATMPGMYWFELSIDGEPRTRCSVIVSQVETGAR